jgi:hypothetical protein
MQDEFLEAGINPLDIPAHKLFSTFGDNLPVIENSVAQYFGSLQYLLQPKRIDAFFVKLF